MSEKIGAQHLRRKAMLYVRQSSPHQVMHNRESGTLQYAMTGRLKAFGFSQIEVVDEDLGRSAAGAVARAGFDRMVAEVCLGKVGANPIPQPAPGAARGMIDFGVVLGFDAGNVVYPAWRMVYFLFSAAVIAGVFAFLRFTTFGMVVRAGMADRETVGLLGIDIDRRFTIVFGIAAIVAGLAGVMYTPILSPDYHMGMDFLVLSFVVVVVGGMGSLGGAVAAGFMLGILQRFASMNEVKSVLPGIDQIIIYLIAVVILLVRPRGLMGRRGVMEH